MGGLIKALAFFGKLKWLAAIPFAGPVLSAVSAAAMFLWRLAKAIASGIGEIVTRPLAAVACVFLCVVVGLLGIKAGVSWDAHMVEAAKVEIASLETKLQAQRDIDDAKAKAAIGAREAAKSAMPLVTGSISKAPDAGASPAAAKSRAAKRVRKPADDDKACGSDFPASLLCF